MRIPIFSCPCIFFSKALVSHIPSESTELVKKKKKKSDPTSSSESCLASKVRTLQCVFLRPAVAPKHGLTVEMSELAQKKTLCQPQAGTHPAVLLCLSDLGVNLRTPPRLPFPSC